MKHIFNVQRAPVSLAPRSILYHALDGKPLAKEVDLRSHDVPVRDQGQTSCCTGFSWTAMHDFVRAKTHNLDPKKLDIGSPLFLYYAERALEGTTGQDAGADMHEGGNVLAKFGICMERTYPFVEANVLRKPTLAAYKEGVQHLTPHFYTLDSLNQMLACLNDGFPFVFGFEVTNEFEGDQMAATGRMPLANWKTQSIGGHAVMAVGYSLSRDELIVRNSWSSSWGDKGYFHMPLALFRGDATVFDACTIRVAA